MRGPLLAGGSSANSEIITPSIPSRLWRNENERRNRGEEEEEKGMHEMKGRGERAFRSKAGDERECVSEHSCIRRGSIIKDHGYRCSLNGWAGWNAGQGAGRMDYELW